MSTDLKISIVIPVYNEAESITPLVSALYQTLTGTEQVIFVNDGSTDATQTVLDSLSKQRGFTVLQLRKNYGQTSALVAGFDHATSDIVVALDGDLENDPADIPRLIKKIQEGFDVVSGWRVSRWKGQALTRRIPSQLANKLISKITGIPLHDYGCTLKAYRRTVLQDVQLYGEMHRFIPAFVAWQGGRVAEIQVNYSPRKYGSSKYGMWRVFKVLLDLVTVKFITSYATRPMHFFGGVGSVSLSLSVITGAWALYLKFFGSLTLTQTPLPLLSALFLLVGAQFILMGLIAEMMTRNYFENSGKKIYNIKKITSPDQSEYTNESNQEKHHAEV